MDMNHYSNMRIGIIGTRGIPNFYGGFEQFAEYLSEALVKKGHDIYVYNSHTHPYQQNEWKGVKILHCYDPEQKIGTAGQFVYDFNCILDSRKRGFDIILQLGYTSSSIWNWLFPRESIIITNMDGLEWKRSKYSKPVQQFLRFAERLAVKFSDYLIADAVGIQSYLKKKYAVESTYIPYGASVVLGHNNDKLDKFSLKKRGYNILVARMEPENNIETILQGFIDSNINQQFVVVGHMDNKYGQYISRKFTDKRIMYLGYVSNLDELNSLRRFSNIYFHGHTVGGTNPSLLEAMSSHAFICAHDNEFNKDILHEDALYFRTANDIKLILEKDNDSIRENYISNNLEKIEKKYSWEKIVLDYESMMNYSLKKSFEE